MRSVATNYFFTQQNLKTTDTHTCTTNEMSETLIKQQQQQEMMATNFVAKKLPRRGGERRKRRLRVAHVAGGGVLALATCQFRFVPQLQNVTKAKGKRNNKKQQKQRKSILQFAKELWATHVYLPKLNLHKKMVTVEGSERGPREERKKEGAGAH